MDLKGNPYFLNDAQIRWVQTTLAGMTRKQKIGQLFCCLGVGVMGNKKMDYLTREIGIGGIMFRAQKAEGVQNIYRRLQASSPIPLLCAANLESGGSGACQTGTNFSMPMGVAATGNIENAYRLGKICCAEGAAVGVNWAFAPIVDVDYNFRNPITNLRTFGSNPDTVLEMGKAYLRAAKEEGVAVSIKHFPGDGVDERDQHILTSVNSLDAESWLAGYGKIYGQLTAAGAQTVMVGHIAQPAMVKAINPQADVEEMYRPASLSPELVNGVLRQRLGFEGLAVTDASTMLGFTTAMPRAKAVPQCIAAGCDMLLFNKNFEEDYRYMTAGVEDGIISPQRLDEAVTRILATKAALGLPEKQAAGALVPGPEQIAQVVGCQRHRQWAAECADAAVTLVKDSQNLLPLSPLRTKRVCLNVIEHTPRKNSPFARQVKEAFEKEGFTVTLRDRTLNLDMGNPVRSLFRPGTLRVLKEIGTDVQTFRGRYDLMVTVANLPPQSNLTTVRLNWNVIIGMGDDAPWYTAEIPSLLISTGNPYHLLDAPMMKTVVNAYTGTGVVLDKVMDKLMGRSPFLGISPVDPFCGHEDTKR